MPAMRIVVTALTLVALRALDHGPLYWAGKSLATTVSSSFRPDTF